jgi:hypothetical protein
MVLEEIVGECGPDSSGLALVNTERTFWFHKRRRVDVSVFRTAGIPV